ncbi:MAG: GntR family transcriptional regulator [Clostridia bacterium]|nr:GntR family transcriptional regulator [Clostridia bacterium]
MISLADKVFERLEQDILSEHFTPGEILTEGKLSAALGVSRTPVREAVRRLEQAGLLKECGKGMIVVGVSRQDLEDIYEIRKRVEGLAARRTAEKVSKELISKLSEALELQEFYTLKRDASHIQALDSLFHKTIYDNCGSGVLQDTLSSMHRRIQRYRKDSVTQGKRAEQAVKEHRAIFEAISVGDGERAEKLAVQHVNNAYNNIISKEQ